jgi:hypothetical protein
MADFIGTCVRCWSGGSKPLYSITVVGERNQSRWNGEAKSLGGLEIDCELEFGRLENWQIGRLGALQDLSNIVASLPIGVRDLGMVAQSEGF